MGHGKNKRKQRSPRTLKNQVWQRYQKMLAFGESKYEAKRNDAMKDKIYSFSTYESYRKHANYFCDWLREHYPECKRIEDGRQYIQEWLDYQNSRGLSAWTLKLEAAALCKLYGITDGDPDHPVTPDRRREDIKRGRAAAVRDSGFSEEQNADLIDVCRCTGLRREELRQLTGDCLERIGEGTYVLHITRGTKGGRHRTVPLMGEPERVRRVAEIIGRAGSEKVFGRINSHADIHSYRAQYATDVYNRYARPIEEIPPAERYVCRRDCAGIVLDKRAMRIASEALGHSRINVIAGHYLKNIGIPQNKCQLMI